MKSFLQSVTHDLYLNEGENLQDISLIFPNKRAGLFFRKYLSEYIDKPVFLPEILTIQEFFEGKCDIVIGNQIELLFDLYQVYKQFYKSAESFNEFYYWGEMLLKDFDDVDKYLVDAENLFKNVKSLKAIEDFRDYLSEEQVQAIQKFWSTFNLDKLTKQQNDFVKLWEVLYPMYKDFNAFLDTQKYAYEGKIYKDVIEKLNQEYIIPEKKVAFIGFNALNTCEERLFEYYKKTGKALFYWDYDQYYTKRDRHQAAYFIKKNLKNFENQLTEELFSNFEKNKNIEIVSVTSKTGQAKFASSIATKYIEDGAETSTAIVLADEQLLFPLLNQLPETNINISMGFPISGSVIFQLLNDIESLQKNKRAGTDETLFYFKDVRALLSNTYIFTNDIYEKAEKYIGDNNLIYLNPLLLDNSEEFTKVFRAINEPILYLKYLQDILRIIDDNLNEDQSKDIFLKEIIYQVYLLLNKLSTLIAKYTPEISFNVLINLLQRLIKTEKIPFSGEPLSGVQVLGLLETRNLDFENIILLSANEGILPSVKHQSSFIPYNLRRVFGLPLTQHNEAIVAYHFYRLIQRANNISLLFNTDSDVFNVGEMSRFLYQLQYESGKNITFKNGLNKMEFQPTKKITMYNDDKVVNKLKYYVDSGKAISATSLINFMECKLKYYFKYILNLKERDEVSEDIDSRILGTIYHEVMQKLYEPYKQKLMSSKIVEELQTDLSTIDDFIHQGISKHLYKNNVKSTHDKLNGKNILLFNIIQSYIKNTILYDKQQLPYTIISVEDYHERKLEIEINGQLLQIVLGGYIDRIEQSGNSLQVIDYKTGSDDLKKVESIQDLFDEEKIKDVKAVFQTLFYMMLIDTQISSENLFANVYLVQKLNTEFKGNVIFKNGDLLNYKKIGGEFEAHIKALIQHIFSSNTSFDQTNNIKQCEYCSFNGICNRA